MRRRIARARPMRALRTSYRGTNVYRFVRETMPKTQSFTILDGAGGFPKMGYMKFDSLIFDDLVKAKAEFGAIFARYHVDKIVTILTPLWTESVEAYHAGANYSLSPSLRITRVNTKYFNDWQTYVSANSQLQLERLAQLQCKTVTKYSSKRSMKLITKNPGVIMNAVQADDGTLIKTRQRQPWLNCTHDADIPFVHNSVIFAERTDGSDLSDAWKYRVVHKVYFRCAQVG